ncbi:hypothetical protein PCYB_002300, partial [Plasmodium cynomolgi strain B]
YNVVRSFTEYKNELFCNKPYEHGTAKSYVDDCNEFESSDLESSTCKSVSACNAVYNFLSHLHRTNDPSYAENGFKYMYYWLYVDVLDSKLNHFNTITLYKDLIDKYEDLNDTPIFKKCINQLNEKNSDNLIKVFTLYNNFNKVKEDYTFDKDKCDSAKKCATTYKDYIDECHKSYDKDFCDELENFRVKFNNHLTSIKNCGDLKELPSFQESSLATTTLLPVYVMSAISFFSFIAYKVRKFSVKSDNNDLQFLAYL